MCGLSGFLDPACDRNGETHLRAMTATLSHRGPDDSGVWLDAETGIGLGHRRLAIVDITEAGHQPMRSPHGRFEIVWNGEIYNHLALRHVLESEGAAPAWRGHSDTETLLACFEEWGVLETVKQAVGMFAIALWDRETRSLMLIRDRMGEKPLYYGWSKGVFLFGSELKALRAHPAFDEAINREALADIVRRHAVGGTKSIYRAFSKVPPGSMVTVSNHAREPEISVYWSLEEAAKQGKERRFAGHDTDAIEALETLLTDAIALQMVADVPVGAFLSGGVDSSLIVALMQRQATQPVKSFTIGFDEEAFNEAPFARDVAHHLGTDHTELMVSPKDALDIIPRLPQLYDEPLADISQVPTYLVAKLARSRVTVSLSGDAGDELFGGYNTYGMAERFFALKDRLPSALRGLIAEGGGAAATFAKLAGKADLARRLRLGASVLKADDSGEMVDRLLGHWTGEKVPVIGFDGATRRADERFDTLHLDDLERMMLRDMAAYLPDDILVKVDRAAMGVSLETRVPLLDHRIVEFALTLPMAMRRRDGRGKFLLREVLYRHVPKALIERPKKGFGVPLAEWLKGPLREWTEAMLEPVAMRADGLFDPVPVQAAWREHLSGQCDRHQDLWPVIVATQWARAKA
jgi:asparagine synthase (glutamine-hydrolysing)